MTTRRANPRLAKIHRSYTVDEAARLFDVHKNTVRAWLKQGLPVVDAKRPILILGKALAEFLGARRAMHRRKCQPGEMYCVRCRAPKAPAGAMAEYKPLTATGGNLVAICPDCHAIMNRRASLAKLGPMHAVLDITIPQAEQHIGKRAIPCVNSDFEMETVDHGSAQPRE